MGNIASENHILQIRFPGHFFVTCFISRPDYDEPGVGDLLFHLPVSIQQILKTLTFLQATNKEDVQLPIAEMFYREYIGGKVFQVNPIRDYIVVSWKVPAHEVPGWFGDSDSSTQLVKPAPENGPSVFVTHIAVVEGMKGAYIDRLGVIEHDQRQHRA